MLNVAFYNAHYLSILISITCVLGCIMYIIQTTPKTEITLMLNDGWSRSGTVHDITYLMRIQNTHPILYYAIKKPNRIYIFNIFNIKRFFWKLNCWD